MDEEPIDPVAAEILGLNSDGSTSSVDVNKLGIPSNVRQLFESTFGQQDKIVGLKSSELFAVAENGDGTINRVYYGYSDSGKGVDFVKRVELKVQEGDKFTPIEINWYDEQGKEVLVSLNFRSSSLGINYHLKLDDSRIKMRWLEGAMSKSSKQELDWLKINGKDIVNKLFGYLFEGTERTYDWAQIKDGHIRCDLESHLLEGDYDKANERVNFEITPKNGQMIQLMIDRFPNFSNLTEEIFPSFLQQNLTDANTELDENWKNNSMVNELLGVTIRKPNDQLDVPSKT